MRMTDTMSPCNGISKEYLSSLAALVDKTGITGWIQLVDTNQHSTREAGKSCCAFFCCLFSDFKSAFSALSVVHEQFPTANVEFQIVPNGTYDDGRGPGSYAMADWQKAMQYLPLHGFRCALLVDVVGVWREITFAEWAKRDKTGNRYEKKD